MSGIEQIDSDSAEQGSVSARRLPWFVAGLALPLFGVGLLLPDTGFRPDLDSDLALHEISPALTLPLLFTPTDLVAGAFGDPEASANHHATTLRVHRGDTLERLFRRANLDLADLQAILKLAPARQYLRLLRPGEEVTVHHDGSTLLELTRRIDVFNTLNIRRAEDGFDARVVELDYQTRNGQASGRINSSLFEAAADAGISDTTIMKLAAIFASEIDFMLDLRSGDHFTLLFEEMWHDGEKLAEGEVLAAEFVNDGRVYRAVRYVDTSGRASYYTPEGRSLRRAFVRAPLSFSRVSSDFNPRRRHPILNTIRAHTGVDYAAPAGTPVHAPADGRVAFRGRKGGYGNTVILEHRGGISTLYGHLSAYARSLRPGQRISQGTTIGYVGATGLATAPHLHYEYRVGGRPVNPRTVKLPDALPIEPAESARFRQAAAPLLRALDDQRSEVATRGPLKRGGTRSS